MRAAAFARMRSTARLVAYCAIATGVFAGPAGAQFPEVSAGSVMPEENRSLVYCAEEAIAKPDRPQKKSRKRNAPAEVPLSLKDRTREIDLSFFSCTRKRLHLRNYFHVRDCFLVKVYLPIEAQSVRRGVIPRSEWEALWLSRAKDAAEAERLRDFLARLANPFALGHAADEQSVSARAEAILPCAIRHENIVRFKPLLD